jgi:flavin reductase (DIM6/NTAB) family NADH-FMN oxidoreductase RutF/DNA-binding IclR family transcriptional regulator
VSIDQHTMRHVLGHYPTGVCVITAIADDGAPVAMTVGTFTSVSLDPPLVGFLPAQASKSFAKLRTASGFCVNVLSADQEALCRAFASSIEDKFAGVAWHPSPSGRPILDGAVAWIDATFEQIVEVGDHFMVTGLVTDLDAPGQGLPLLFFERGYGRFTPLQYVPKSPAALISVMQQVEASRHILDQVADAVGHEVVVTVPVDDQIIHVAATGGPGLGPSPMAGKRLPLAPPLGTLLVMDAPEAERDAWLARSSRAGEPGDREALLALLAQAKSQGWVLSRKSPLHDDLDVVLDQIAHDAHTPGQARELIRIFNELRESYDVAASSHDSTVRMLAVPVRDASQRVVFQLAVHDIEIHEESPELLQIRDALIAAARQIEALDALKA